MDGDIPFHILTYSACGSRTDRIYLKIHHYDTADSKSLLRSIIKEMGLDEKVYKPGTVQARISNAKNHLVSPAGYANNKEAYEGDCAAKMPAIRDIYRRYWERCRQADAMDFDDLLFYTFLLFRDHPDVLARYQSQFRYILVDEYQDTNFAQHSIVLQLAKEHRHVCVVGMMHRAFILSGERISTTYCISQKYIRARRSLNWNRTTAPPKQSFLQPTV